VPNHGIFCVKVPVVVVVMGAGPAKAEYLYLNFGSHTFLAGTGFDTNIKLQDNIVRLGLNYKFTTH
jgi:hypothetical protein